MAHSRSELKLLKFSYAILRWLAMPVDFNLIEAIMPDLFNGVGEPELFLLVLLLNPGASYCVLCERNRYHC
jgi:hypothetical protein